MKIALAMAGLLAVSTAAMAQTPAPIPPPAPCGGPAFRQFDFWVGHWDVYPNGSDRMIAHSLIEDVYSGCAIRENWMPLAAGSDGGSLSNFVADDGVWRQTWVDSSGARVEFKGGYAGSNQDGAMVLTGFWPNVRGAGKGALVRMTYTRQPGGAVRQLGEASTDEGKTWQPNFDFIYRPSSLKTPLGG